MPVLTFTESVPSRKQLDAEVLVKVCEAFDYTVTPLDAYKAWLAFSTSRNMAWLLLSIFTPGELVDIVRQYCEEVTV